MKLGTKLGTLALPKLSNFISNIPSFVSIFHFPVLAVHVNSSSLPVIGSSFEVYAYMAVAFIHRDFYSFWAVKTVR